MISTLAARPRYGGTLRVHPQPLIDSLNTPIADVCDIQHDAMRRAWTLTVRPGVLRHDRSPLTIDALVAALKPHSLDLAAAATSRNIIVTAARPHADVRSLLKHRIRIDCGPFILHAADRGAPSSAPWAEAFEDHPDGRPYVDRVELASAPQAAHVAELLPGSVRQFRSAAHRIWASQPVALLAIDAPALSNEQRNALSLSLDREAIVRFILQGQGEPTGALSPQWRSGYAFLFRHQRDVARARQISRASATSLAYQSADPTARLMAERIALNARDAGMDIRPVAARAGNIASLVRIPAPSFDSYESEKSALEERALIPLAHVPRIFAVHNRVNGWDEAHAGHRYSIQLEDVWLTP